MTQFLLQLISKFLAKTPKFFKIIRNVGVALAVVTGLPSFIESAGVVLPEAIQLIASKVVSIASLVAAFIAQLTENTDSKD